MNRVFPYQEVNAYIGKKKVGLFSFRRSDEYIRANGTEILPEYQRQGIGQALWKTVIDKYKPKGIIVCTVTEEGEKFVAKLNKLYPHLEWDNW